MSEPIYRGIYCQYDEAKTPHAIYIQEKGPHYAKVICRVCGHWHWMKKPKNEGKRPPNKYTPADLGINYCQICLRSRNDLIKTETLEVHHIIEVGKDGEDVPENCWVVCTPCHRIIHYNRTYLRRASNEYDT